MAYKVVFFGNVTIDQNSTETGTYTGPGGSVYFGAKIAENLGMIPILVSSYGKDFPKTILPKTTFIPKAPISEKTLVFENIHNSTGDRTQRVRHYQREKPAFFVDSLPLVSSPADSLIIAPILDNMTAEEIGKMVNHFPKSLKIFLPQGLYRVIREGGTVEKKGWSKWHDCIPLFDIVIVSESDGIDIEEKVKSWSISGPLGIVTKAEKGCTLYQKGEKREFPAFLVPNVVDSTGAGDIFAVSLAYAYLESRDIVSAIEFAQGGAAYSLRFNSNQLQYSESDIYTFIKAKGRRREV